MSNFFGELLRPGLPALQGGDNKNKSLIPGLKARAIHGHKNQ